MLTDDPQINHCLEQICERGCREVNVVISQLEAGKRSTECAVLDEAQTARLLAELKAVMAVYAETGSCSV